MSRYHLRIKKFHPKTLEHTETLMASKPWKQEDAVANLDEFEKWLASVSLVYGVEQPSLSISEDPIILMSRGGYFENTITLPKFSVMTLMHEYRHHMQFHGLSPVALEDRAEWSDEFLASASPTEEDARAWSCSLFYKVRPHLFRRSVREGKILYVEAEDLLRTPQSTDI